MNKELQMQMTGNLGEKIARKFMIEKGYTIEDSVSMYDHEKDFTANGKTVEVKTQQPFHLENAFSIRYNQIKKCESVDYLIFIETPSGNNGHVIQIWFSPKNKRNFRSRRLKSGTTMYLIDKSDCILAETIDDMILINEMKSFTLSTWKKR